MFFIFSFPGRLKKKRPKGRAKSATFLIRTVPSVQESHLLGAFGVRGLPVLLTVHRRCGISPTPKVYLHFHLSVYVPVEHLHFPAKISFFAATPLSPSRNPRFRKPMESHGVSAKCLASNTQKHSRTECREQTIESMTCTECQTAAIKRQSPKTGAQNKAIPQTSAQRKYRYKYLRVAAA